MDTTTLSSQTLWQRWTKPHPDITEPIQRQRAHLMTRLTLVIFILGAVLVAGGLIFNLEATWGMPYVVLFLFVYVLSRTRQAIWGAGLLVFGGIALILATLFAMPDPANLSRIALFMLVPILFAMLLLPSKGTVWAAVLANISLVLFFALVPRAEIEQAFASLMITFLVSVMAAGATFLRERDLYVIQQQMDRLRDADQLRDSETRKILAIAEVGRAIAGTRNLSYLLRQVVDLVIERFEVHYAQLFLVEEASGSAILKAATGTAGSELVSQGYQIPPRSQSAVSRVMETGDAIIVSDINADPTYQYSNLLPNTRSEIVLPLRTGGQIIGVLDIQSADAETFVTAELSGFQAMADQIAIAIENVRLYERAQHDLQDIESLNRQLTGESWHKFLAGRPSAFALGYEASERGVRPLEVKEISQDASHDDGTVTLPLKVRGETIGLLDLTPRSGREPDMETRAMLEAVAERVAMALDSTRLGDQAQYQAEREEILGSLSAELQATTDLNTILRVVSRTASRSLETPTGFVHLAVDYSVEHKKEDTG